jgi:hypothetical protein
VGVLLTLRAVRGGPRRDGFHTAAFPKGGGETI